LVDWGSSGTVAKPLGSLLVGELFTGWFSPQAGAHAIKASWWLGLFGAWPPLPRVVEPIRWAKPVSPFARWSCWCRLWS